MTAIGLGCRTRGLAGWDLVMTKASSLRDTGSEIAASLPMTIAGTATGSGITVGAATTTVTVVGIATVTGIAIVTGIVIASNARPTEA